MKGRVLPSSLAAMSEAPAEPQRFWIRNDQGKVWGPMAPTTLALLIPQGVFPGRLQASTDGLSFAMIGRFPNLREGLPESYWGVDPAEVAAAEAVDPTTLAPVEDEALDPTTLAPVEDEALDPTTLAPEPPPEPEPEPAPIAPAVEVPAEGDVAQTSVLRLAYLVAAAGFTGEVTVEGPAGVASVFYRRGAPERVEVPGADLGAWLVSEGLLGDDRRQQAEAARGQFGGSLTTALFSLGLLDPGAAFQHLARHGAEAYAAFLCLEAGRFRADPDASVPPDAFSLGVPPLSHLVAASRRLAGETVARCLGPRLAAPAMLANASAVAIEDLGLGPQEARLYTAFDGVHSVAEIAARPDVDDDTLTRLAFLLGELDFLSFGDDDGAAAGAGQGAAPPPGPDAAGAAPVEPAAPAAPAAPATDWAGETRRLIELRDRLAKADHFRALGLKRQCSAADVKQAYTDAVRRYHPDRAVGAPEATRAVLRELFERVNAAYRAIGDDAKRRAYANELAASSLEASGAGGAGAAAAQTEVAKARHLIKLNKHGEAASLLDGVLGQNPGNAAAWSWRAWLKVAQAKDRKAVRQEAVGLIARALKIDPRCADAYLVAARIAKTYGDATNAAKYAQKAKALGCSEDP